MTSLFKALSIDNLHKTIYHYAATRPNSNTYGNCKLIPPPDNNYKASIKDNERTWECHQVLEIVANGRNVSSNCSRIIKSTADGSQTRQSPGEDMVCEAIVNENSSAEVAHNKP